MNDRGILLSRCVDVASLPPSGRDMTFEANATERDTMAQQLEIPGVCHLKATFTLRPLPGAGRRVHMEGVLQARLNQLCSATLAVLETDVESRFERSFIEAGANRARSPGRAGIDIVFDEDDEPDVYEKGQIDIGRVLAEELVLAFDPFVRCEGAEFLWSEDGDNDIK